jgi:hypothetical protein
MEVYVETVKCFVLGLLSPLFGGLCVFGIFWCLAYPVRWLGIVEEDRGISTTENHWLDSYIGFICLTVLSGLLFLAYALGRSICAHH